MIHIYLANSIQACEAQFNRSTQREGTGGTLYAAARMLNEAVNPISSIPMGGSLTLELLFRTLQPVAYPAISARLNKPLGQDTLTFINKMNIARKAVYVNFGDLFPVFAERS